ncbi:MAG: DUF3060 domain-containing protein [Planctomycetota bacterium]
MKFVVLLVASLLFTANLCVAQTPGVGDPIAVANTVIRPGEKLTDIKGATVSVPSTATGRLKVQHDGQVSGPDRNGCYTTTGEISRVTSKKSGGASAFIVDTDGESIEIFVQSDGSASQPNTVTVTGGSATVNVTGDHNNITVGGAGNNVTLSGSNNSGMGATPPPMGPPPSGNVTLGGSGNTWSSNGGNWVIMTD